MVLKKKVLVEAFISGVALCVLVLPGAALAESADRRSFQAGIGGSLCVSEGDLDSNHYLDLKGTFLIRESGAFWIEFDAGLGMFAMSAPGASFSSGGVMGGVTQWVRFPVLEGAGDLWGALDERISIDVGAGLAGIIDVDPGDHSRVEWGYGKNSRTDHKGLLVLSVAISVPYVRLAGKWVHGGEETVGEMTMSEEFFGLELAFLLGR